MIFNVFSFLVVFFFFFSMEYSSRQKIGDKIKNPTVKHNRRHPRVPGRAPHEHLLLDEPPARRGRHGAHGRRQRVVAGEPKQHPGTRGRGVARREHPALLQLRELPQVKDQDCRESEQCRAVDQCGGFFFTYRCG
jgi:hypothetical protein